MQKPPLEIPKSWQEDHLSKTYNLRHIRGLHLPSDFSKWIRQFDAYELAEAVRDGRHGDSAEQVFGRGAPVLIAIKRLEPAGSQAQQGHDEKGVQPRQQS